MAYLRFASVYQHYDSVDDFEAEIQRHRDQIEARAATAGPPTPDHLL